MGDTIGRRSSADLTFGQIVPNIPSRVSSDGRKIKFGVAVGITTPTAVMIIDQLVHRPTFPRVDCNFIVEWQKTLSDPVTDSPVAPLPFRERIVKLDRLIVRPDGI